MSSRLKPDSSVSHHFFISVTIAILFSFPMFDLFCSSEESLIDKLNEDILLRIFLSLELKERIRLERGKQKRASSCHRSPRALAPWQYLLYFKLVAMNV